MNEADPHASPQAVLLRARSMILCIYSAISEDMAEQQTLEAAGYLTRAQAAGLISDDQYEKLTQAASDALRQWLPPLP